MKIAELTAVEAVKQQLHRRRVNDHKFTTTFEAAQALRGDEETVKPRVSSVRRQPNRVNRNVDSALDYYRATADSTFLVCL